MKTSGLVLIPETIYGFASGNYDGSSASFNGDRKKGVGYYKRSASTQTIRFITDDFVGTITLQASLDTDPTEDTDWFDVYTFPDDSVPDGSTAISADFSTSVTGNFVWLRATVSSFAGGQITSVTITY